METLHRQVLPFLLRRLKEDVLQDLLPKIIQDYYCKLSPLQVQLYEDFAKSQFKRGLEETVSHIDGENKSEKASKDNPHVFQKLMYRQLLIDCGVGVGSSTPGSSDLSSDPVVSQRRVLWFCQLKSMLDIVENDLLKKDTPTVTYLRLDRSTPAGSRDSLVKRFNNDPSIDILLLTTHVGGLGLNLTGADTVIFVEHDWNPMKDLQAMDRAHRIGQKKVVIFYDYAGKTGGKIMGLQKFKLNIANTVISQENSSLLTMDTGQLLHGSLFSRPGKGKGKSRRTTVKCNWEDLALNYD